MAVMDYSQQQRVIDGTGRILDTTMTNPNTGSWVSEQQLKTWINTGMATDADLAAEVAQREADISDVKNALTAVDHRVQNLESAKGDYVAVDSDKGVISVPSGKGKWAVVEKLRGVSRVQNNQAKILVDSTTLGAWRQFNYSSNITANTSTNTISVKASGSTNRDALCRLSSNGTYTNHAYVVSMKLKNNYTDRSILARLNKWGNGAGSTIIDVTLPANSTTSFSYLVNANNSMSIELLGFAFFDQSGLGAESTIAIDIIDPVISDLNLYFGGTIPSDADTLAEIQTYYPWLLEPSDYGTSLVDSVYEGVKSVGVNIFDEITEEGAIDGTTGQDTPASNFIRSKNFIRLEYGKAYYFLAPSAIRVRGYDINKNFVRTVLNGYNSTVSASNLDGIFYVRFDVPSVSSYGHNIQICLDSYTDKTTYHPYMTDTLSLPTPITLRSAGSVAEVYDLETGKVSHPIGVQDLSQLGWTLSGSTPNAYYATMNGYAYKQDCGAVCDKWQYIGTVSTGTSGLANYDKVIVIYYNSTIPNVREVYLRDTSITSASQISGTLYFELATPLAPTQLDPIQNPTILTESGGTISAQTEEPIDGNFSVGFITL